MEESVREGVLAAEVKTPDVTPMAEKRYLESVRSVNEVGEYMTEDDDPNVLIYGPWLERGGSAFWISTAGTGKSIACMQLAHCMAAGLSCFGLRPHGKLMFWVFQSEDSPRRVAQDRIDVRAELAEQHPEVDWQRVGKERVKFCEIKGAVGVDFLRRLDDLLVTARRKHQAPDVIVLNPFLAYIGGPITDGKYVTPFLRGGDINGEHTDGLQALLQKHNVGVLVFHHTPKPPTEKEVDAWMKSRFPEYQGAGSSDITNWGRSFITMMRVPNHANMVFLTAGKNGGELGWERIGNASRRYMAYSKADGVNGKGRHAWRDLDEVEYAEIVGGAKTTEEKDTSEATAKIAEEIKASGAAYCKEEINTDFARRYAREKIRAAIASLFANPQAYRLTVKPILRVRGSVLKWVKYIGLSEPLDSEAKAAEQERKLYDREREMAKSAQNARNVEAPGATVAPQTAQPAEGNAPDGEEIDPFLY